MKKSKQPSIETETTTFMDDNICNRAFKDWCKGSVLEHYIFDVNGTTLDIDRYVEANVPIYLALIKDSVASQNGGITHVPKACSALM